LGDLQQSVGDRYTISVNDASKKDELMAFYVQTWEMIRHHGTLQWEGIKHTTTLYTALLAFHATSLGAYLAYGMTAIAKLSPDKDLRMVGAILLAAPVSMLVLATAGWFELRRETRRLHERFGIAKSIERILNLDGSLAPDSRVFTKQERIMPKRFDIPPGVYTNEGYVNSVLGRPGGFFFIMTCQHGLLALIALAVTWITAMLVLGK
jgi:hypothetical protein